MENPTQPTSPDQALPPQAAPKKKTGLLIGLLIGAAALIAIAAIVLMSVLGGSKVKSYDELKTEITRIAQANNLEHCHNVDDTLLAESLNESFGEDRDKLDGVLICSTADFSSVEALASLALDEAPQMVIGFYSKETGNIQNTANLDDFGTEAWAVGDDQWAVIGITAGDTAIKDTIIKDLKAKDLVQP